ncbi:MAG TPA: hypothetical protein VF551_08500 [Chthoniobacterales bacterium]|jgi:arabinofuranosyltransferase
MTEEARATRPATVAAGPLDREFRYAAVVLLLLLLIIMIKSAWLSEDAYIGYRSIDNLLNGYGFRWNTSERVQVFTDPLKLLIFAVFYAITHELFVTTIVISILWSFAAAILLVTRIASSSAAGVAALAALVSSRAFIDYTTSGLDNPLNYLLAAAFAVYFFRGPITLKTFQFAVFFASLAAFNRLDVILIFSPPVAYAAWVLFRRDKLAPRVLLKAAFIYSAPLWGWLLFSTIYYGFTFPNTYYGKLYIGVPKSELRVQGLLYYINSINFDPLTLIVIGLGVSVAVASRDGRLIAGAVGVLLYLLYIVNIGGDFMSGRFFSLPFFCAVVFLVQRPAVRTTWIGLAVLFVAIGLLAQRPALLNDESYRANKVVDFSGMDPNSVIDRRGIADERGSFYHESGLLPLARRKQFTPTHWWAATAAPDVRAKGRQIVVFGNIGFFGFHAGPDVHIVDYFGLGDPLLSKLPIIHAAEWRVGHYARSIPDGYIESIQKRKNRIVNPKVHELYDVVRTLAKGRIWSGKRFREIVKINLGFYNGTIRSITVEDTLPNPQTPPVPGSTYPWPEDPQR